MNKIFQRISADIKKYFFAAIAFYFYYLTVHFFAIAFCPSVSLTGFPCPGCGLVRAVLSIAQGQFLRAYYLNPSVYIWLLAALWIGYHRYVKGEKVPGLSYVLCFAAAAMVVIYIYRLYKVYPSYAPMVYTKGNLLSRIFEHYEQFLRSLYLIQ